MPVLKNTRHEQFAKLIAKGSSKREAYAETFGRPKDRCGPLANKLLKNVKVARRIREIQRRGARRAETTVQSLVEEAEEARQLAMEIANPGAAVQAIQAKAKMTGNWVDRQENLNTNYEISDETPDEEQWEKEFGEDPPSNNKVH